MVNFVPAWKIFRMKKKNMATQKLVYKHWPCAFKVANIGAIDIGFQLHSDKVLPE